MTNTSRLFACSIVLISFCVLSGSPLQAGAKRNSASVRGRTVESLFKEYLAGFFLPEKEARKKENVDVVFEGYLKECKVECGMSCSRGEGTAASVRKFWTSLKGVLPRKSSSCSLDSLEGCSDRCLLKEMSAAILPARALDLSSLEEPKGLERFYQRREFLQKFLSFIDEKTKSSSLTYKREVLGPIKKELDESKRT